ncbi:MAG: transposase, partial [Victivallaceae bacterium]|nr:transposase [Victivallaceae bacterium]
NEVPKHKLMELEADEFIRRFIQHIPPANFMRNRFYGIIAGAKRAEKLTAAREQLSCAELLDSSDDCTHSDELFTDFQQCPQCESGTMEEIETLAHSPPHIIFRNEIARGRYAA